MSIQKMKLVSVVGPVNEFDRVISDYLLDCDIHIENAAALLSNVRGLYPYSDDNAFRALLAKVEDFFRLADIDPASIPPTCATEAGDGASELIQRVEDELSATRAQRQELDAHLEENAQILKQLEHMQTLDVNLDEVFGMRFIKFRFGRLPKAGYKKLMSYLSDIDAFFLEGEVDQDYVYGIYFMPAEFEEKIDGIFSSLYFERIIISGESHGSPAEAFRHFKEEGELLARRRDELAGQARAIVEEHRAELEKIYASLLALSQAASIRKYAAHTRESFYVVGWVSAREAKSMEEKLAKEENILLVEEDPSIITKASPPIKLKNPALFRPFEMFVRMYGLPSYHELDPTPLLAVTYVLMFGIMFGDLGHGLILLVGGLLFYKLKKMDLGGIVALAGFCSMIFGLLYGSVFGNEEILRELAFTKHLAVIHPMVEINTILIATVALGAVIILLAMAVNIINAVKNRQWGRMLFDQNGLAGVVFYCSVIAVAVNMFIPFGLAVMPVALIGIVLPLLLIFLKEPLSGLAEGKPDWKPKKIGEFILESFFELFEIVLSFATNTISFVRLGAFALGHGSMMSVVFILAGMTSGAGSVIILILGNILVIALEGLVVGIQALRLEFYEMFSRYYTGDGREFISIREPMR